MKKNTIKAFTLVEMLIVIVIIGILIAALLPRMQAAQWRARDVARKTALSHMQSAIVTYQGDHGKWPKQDEVTDWTGIKAIEKELIQAWMTEVPSDPLNGTTFTWIGSDGNEISDFGYVVAKRNSVRSGWFALMAKTEVAWWSNWVVCGPTDAITWGTDLREVHPCSNVVESDDGSCSNPHTSGANSICTWNLWDMRYIVLY